MDILKNANFQSYNNLNKVFYQQFDPIQHSVPKYDVYRNQID